MKFDRKREFTPISITLENPSDVEFLIRVYEKAMRERGLCLYSSGDENFIHKCKDHLSILNRMYKD